MVQPITRNNFDQSSTGINVEFTGRRDVGLAEMYFEEFLQRRDIATGTLLRGHTDYVVMVDNYEECPWTWAELRAMTKEELLHIFDVVEDYRDEDQWTKKALIDDIRGGIDWQDWVSWMAQYYGWGDLPDECWDFRVNGYSQGDSIKVWDARKNPEGREDLAENLRNIFFDTPISGSVRVWCGGGTIVEVYLDEILGQYDLWDPRKFMEEVKKKYPELGEETLYEIKSVLPEYLDIH